MALSSVLIDQREPASIRELRFGGVPILSTLLEAGDVIATCDDGASLVIERKTATDFLNTLRDERLFPQLRRMREISPWSYLAIVGALRADIAGKAVADGRETGWNWASVAGALLTVQEIGVHVLLIETDLDFEAAIIRLANRERKTVHVPPPRDVVQMSDELAILTAFPGVGLERASALLQSCNTPANAIEFLTDDDPAEQSERVPGVGPGIKKQVRKALGLNDAYMLSVTMKVPPITRRKKS